MHVYPSPRKPGLQTQTGGPWFSWQNPLRPQGGEHGGKTAVNFNRINSLSRNIQIQNSPD